MAPLPPATIGGHKQKPKPKWVASRGGAMKEIETWALDGASRDVARGSGQLAENVTEQRLLQAKLWEMSKERHKFLSQNTYDKKMFLERQRRKSHVFRDLLRDVTVDSRGTLSRNFAASGDGSKRLNARMALLHRLDPTNGRDRPREMKDAKDAHRAALEQKRPRSLPLGALETRLSQDVEPVAPLFPTEPKEITAAERPTRLPQLPRDSRAGSRLSSLHQAATIGSWARKPSRKREPEGPVADSRYVALCDALTKAYVTNGRPSVAALIESIESLHVRCHRPLSESKPRLALKVQDFMRERGLVF